MSIDVRQWIYTCWGVFFFGWMLWGVTAKRAKRRQAPGSRFAQVAVFGVSFWMLFSRNLQAGPFGRQLWQESVLTEFVAIAFTLIGFGIAIWARVHLAGNWSATVTVKHEHELVQTGPYAFVRHPIYTGVSVTAMGLAILNGDLRSFAAVALMVIGWRMKFQLEEQFMTEEFGDGYLQYKKRVKAVIPFLW